MRTLVKVHITLEAEAAAFWKISVQQILQEAMEELKPEAAFFTAEHGMRTAYFLLDHPRLAKVPSVCEPFVTDLGARIDMVPAMNLAEVRAEHHQDEECAQGTGHSGACIGSDRRSRRGAPRSGARGAVQGRSGESKVICDSKALHKAQVIYEPRIIPEPQASTGDSPAADEYQVIEKAGTAGPASREGASPQENQNQGQNRYQDPEQGPDPEPETEPDRDGDRQVFVDPSGRRKKILYYGAMTVGCAFAGYLLLLVIVFFVAGQPPKIADPFTAERSPSRTSGSAADTSAEVRPGDRIPADVRPAAETAADAPPSPPRGGGDG